MLLALDADGHILRSPIRPSSNASRQLALDSGRALAILAEDAQERVRTSLRSNAGRLVLVAEANAEGDFSKDDLIGLFESIAVEEGRLREGGFRRGSASLLPCSTEGGELDPRSISRRHGEDLSLAEGMLLRAHRALSHGKAAESSRPRPPVRPRTLDRKIDNQPRSIDNRIERLGSHAPLPVPPSKEPPPTPPATPTPAVALKSLSAGWPADVDERASELAAVHHAYRQEYAAQLKPIIDEYINRSVKHSTSYEEKKIIIKHINELLRLGGLAVRCEARDDAGHVVAVHPGIFVIGTARHEGGRFRVEYRDAQGKVRRLGLTDDSPSVELMPDPAEHSRSLAALKAGSFSERLARRQTQADEGR